MYNANGCYTGSIVVSFTQITMRNQQIVKASYVKTGRGLVTSLGLILFLCLSLIGAFFYLISTSKLYASVILAMALLALLLLRRYSIDLPSVPVNLPTGDIVGSCPNCGFILTMPRSTPVVSCPGCEQWIRIQNRVLYKIDREHALSVAASTGLTETVKVLLSIGTDADAPDESGNTALKAAACGGYAAVVKTLLAAGADVNARGGDNSTPLMYAAMTGRSDVVRMLLDAGAEVNVTNHAGYTALMLARDRRYEQLVTLLKQAGAK